MKKILFERVAIVGVGLMGGSVGLAVKKKKLAKFVTGIVRRKISLNEALSSGAVDMATLDLAKGVRNADLVILCAPVSTIVSQIKTIRKNLKRGAIVIDVGSSKKVIEDAAKRHLKGVAFVGCHPMAGSEKQGAMNAEAGLFEGSVCFVTGKNSKVEAFWKSLGAKTVRLNPVSHDRWVAAVSHLPHALSFSLLTSIAGDLKRAPISGKDANPSLKVFARLAQSDPALWADIFISNKKETARAASAFAKKLKALSAAISSGNKNAIVRLLDTGHSVAEKIS